MLGASNLARPTPYGANALIDAFRQAAALGDKEVCALLQAASGGKDEPWRDGSRSADVARERGHLDLALAIEARAEGQAWRRLSRPLLAPRRSSQGYEAPAAGLALSFRETQNCRLPRRER